jgi:Holliday junction resolvase RusA-like endonuclease
MEREINLILYHIPVPWARPGQSRWRRYDTQRYLKDELSYSVMSQMTDYESLHKIVALQAEFYFPKPSSFPKRKYASYHTKKPDLDNLLKFYLDLCKDCGCYEDDAQICFILAWKKYINIGDNPHVILKFKEIEEGVDYGRCIEGREGTGACKKKLD